MVQKLIEHTYGTHIYMKMQLDSGRIEEIDVYLRDNSESYHTSADNGIELDMTDEDRETRNKLRNEIIDTFKRLY